MRTALGASRFRVIRQLLTESVLLSTAGGAVGLLLSLWLTKLLISVSPPNSPRFDEIRPDTRVFLFTLALAVLTGLVFGLAPALQASRINLNERLKEGGRMGGGSSHNRVRSMMMVSEVALSFVLLVGAGLLIKSFIRLRDVSPGFNSANVLTADRIVEDAAITVLHDGIDRHFGIGWRSAWARCTSASEPLLTSDPDRHQRIIGCRS